MTVTADTADTADLAARVQRLEALDEIRQLAAKYAVCLDMRDLDALANLFVDDVGVPGGRRGRAALRNWYDEQMRRDVLGTTHGVHGHVIDVHGPDDASGLVYSRNDLETDGAWMTEILAYLDQYRRAERHWFFVRRTPLFWYRCDATDPPLGPRKMRWKGEPWREGTFHDAFPSWEEFWARDAGPSDAPVPDPAPSGGWLHDLRRGRGVPRVDPTGRRRSTPTSSNGTTT